MKTKIIRALGALANNARLDILRVLVDKTRTVSELQLSLVVKQPAMSANLRVLRLSGLIDYEIAERQHFYSVTPYGRKMLAFVNKMDALTQAE